jgi:peptidoglycan hydrolase CwlO-like protein
MNKKQGGPLMNQKRTRKGLTLLVCGAFFIQTIPSVSFAQNNYQSEINNIKKKRNDVNAKTEATKQKVETLKADQANVVVELEKLDAKTKATKAKIDSTQSAVTETKSQIKTLKKEITDLQKRIDIRQGILKNRMRALQDSGGMVSYIDVILGSNSFGDLIQRMNTVQIIMHADSDIIDQQNNDLESVSSKKDEVTSKQTKLENNLASLVNLHSQLNQQTAAKNKLMASLKSQEKDAESVVMDLQEQDQLLAAQQKAMQIALVEAKKREAEAKRQAEVERKRQEAQKQNSRSNSNSSSNSGSSDNNVPPVSSGMFTRPAAGYISSGFGERSFEGGEFHPGVDIANTGSVPVVAAADGVVIRAYQSSTYGNVVFISHNINGQVWTTVYAHLREYIVSAGSYVSKGQQIGYMGNTGHSTGQHLHFELHKGEWNYQKTNAVDPQKYINF